MFDRLASRFLGYMVRRQRRKFLQLEKFDRNVLPAARTRNLTLYVHIPFCRFLCPFCSFTRFPYEEACAKHYFTALRKEIDYYLKRGYDFSRVYFGGGTPTLLLDDCCEFIEYLEANLDVSEFSVETTPSELTAQNIDCLHAAGVDRLSVGVQSFNRKNLDKVGRRDIEPAAVKENIINTRDIFKTVNVDFIFNYPGQTLKELDFDIENFKSLDINQVTFYPLMSADSNGTQNLEKQLYNHILEKLPDAGFSPSTVWCFTRGDGLIDEYIVDSEEYVGIGCGAISFISGNFYINRLDLSGYYRAVDEDNLAINKYRSLTAKTRARYYMLLKLFGLEFDQSDFNSRFATSPWKMLPQELSFLKLFGLITGKDTLRPTKKGMYAVSVMMRDFFAGLNLLRKEAS